ncbi:minor capsid protein [Paenibacillus sinopodophylli]|uniref:minor capsid protein n=1 Tax=Paenibacillus sinopodophylli TaxID=1837342 RepID=UPI00110D0435|nr:minor capsid protein [Paenibacillus sinopodophylli]
MKPEAYWNKRTEQIANGAHLQADAYAAKLKDEYRKAQIAIQRDLDAFYARFANNNAISFAEAQTVLTKGQLKDFKLTLREFQALAVNNPDGRWTTKLNNAYFKQRVTRLESLYLQIENALRVLSARETEGLKAAMSNAYVSTYYQTQFMINQGLGVAVSLVKIDTKTLESIVARPWIGSNYSKRIWGNTDKLVVRLQTDFTQAIIRGESNTKLARQLEVDMGVSFRQAERLVRTESSFIQNEASYDSYKQSEVVGKYRYLATLDSRTSTACRGMDNKVFDLKDKQIGVTWPPLHANCRSTTVPQFDDNFDIGERIAKDEEGKTIYVPASMNYKEYHESFIGV